MKSYETVKALIQYKNKFLVVEKEDFIGGKYEVPGGRKLPGESDEIALKREVREEVGLEIKIIRLLNRWSLDLPGKDMHLEGKTYLCDSFFDDVKLSKEHTSYFWVSKYKLKELDIPFWLKEAVSCL